MKFIKSQDKHELINAKDVFNISITDSLDEDDDGNDFSDIDVFFDANEDSIVRTIATYRKLDVAVSNLDKLANFLTSGSASGLYEMPKDPNDF